MWYHVTSYLKRYKEMKRERALHDDLDYKCRYWWGDRAGSLSARCSVCNPA